MSFNNLTQNNHFVDETTSSVYQSNISGVQFTDYQNPENNNTQVLFGDVCKQNELI